MRPYWITACSSITASLQEEMRHRHRGESLVKAKAQIGAMQVINQRTWEILVTIRSWREAWNIFILGTSQKEPTLPQSWLLDF
jgi:hypothetical protein